MLRESATLSALTRLTERGYVGREDGEKLHEAYAFLRTLEHRIQLHQLRRTHVVPEDEALLTTVSGDPAKPSPQDPAGRARAMQYDIALNGWELGGGSIRIWSRDLLIKSFGLQGYALEQMQERFGAMLEAFEYGAPPHGGIAIGIDRWAALLSDQTNIREVMAFPKTQSGSDLMLEAPSAPDEEQYQELGLRFVGVPERR